MNAVSKLAEAARKLSLEEQRALMVRLEVEIREREKLPAEGPRIFGLGKGKWKIADDFDAPLLGDFGADKQP